jgi:hypothetical protein
MTELGKTPWVDRNLKTFWDRIAAEVPESWMPAVAEEGPRGRFTVEEYGCGHYGCVMPTAEDTIEDNIVFKLTSDVTEARFVVMAKELPPTEGIVKYYKIFALPDATHRRRPLFVLWRQGAKDIGLLAFGGNIARARKFGYDEYHVRNIREGEQYLFNFLNIARDVKIKFNAMLKRAGPEGRERVLTEAWNAFENAPADADPRYYRGVPRIGVGLRQCWDLAMMIANTDVVYPLGIALGHYIDEGILLADVHLNNIGRDIENDQLIITDPGHAVEFHPRWTELPKVPII